MSSRTTRVLYDLVARDNASRTFVRVGEAASGLERRSTAVGAAIAKGLMVGTVAVGAIGVASVHMATQFQTSMTKINTQAGASTKDVKILSDQVLKLGGKVQQAPEQLADSLYHLKSVGMDNVQAMKALKEASDLAAVGGADLEETTNALAGAWRTGIKGATSFHLAVSTVNAIIGAGNMTMQQFNAAIGTGILPSAKTFGLSLQQVGAALALMTDEGIDSASAATRLRMSFSLLGAPSKAAEKQLGKIGLTGLQLADAMRGKDGLIGAIQLLKDHLDASGMSASEQSQVLSRAFGGGRSSSGILLMINNLDVLKKKQDQVNHSAGKFDDAVAAQRKTVQAQWDRLTSGLESASVKLGIVLLPPVANFIGYLNDKGLPAVEKFGAKLAGIVPVGKITSEFRTVTSMVSDFFKGLEGPKKKTPKKAAVLPTPQLKPVAAAASLLPAHGRTVLPSPMLKAPSVPKSLLPAAPSKSDAQKLGDQVRAAVSGGIEHLDWGKVGSSVGSGLGKAFEWVGQHGTELTKKLGVAIGGIDWVNVGKVFGKTAIPMAIGFIDNAFEPLFHVDFWKKHWLDTILAVISVIPVGKLAGVALKLGGRLAGAVGDGVSHVPWSKIIPFSEKLAESVGPLVRGIGRWVGDLVDGFTGAFSRRFPRIGQKFSDELVLLPVRLEDLKTLLVRKSGELLGKFGDALVNHIPGMGNKFIRGTVKFFARFTFWETGVHLAEGLFSGIWSRIKDAGSWLKSHLVDPVVNHVKSLFGVHSPSTVFAGIGGNLIAGLKNGVINGAKDIGGWIVSHVVTPVTSRFSEAGSWLVGKGSSLVSGLKNGVVTQAKGIGGWTTSHVITPARNVFSGAGSWLKSKGSALVSGLKSGITGTMKGIASWVRGTVVDPIVNAVKSFFGIKSPSRVFMSIGGHLVTGLMKGMAKHSGKAIASKVFGSLPKALASIAKKGLVSLSSLPSKALKALGGLGGDVLGMLGLGGGGGGSSANQKIGQVLASARGWSGPQWAALKNLWNGESGWNEKAYNKASGATGIPQSLPGSKMASAGADWKTNPATQIKWGLGYIASRYGNPLNAYSAWLGRSPHWYAKGTRGAAKGLAWVGEKGAELVNFGGGEDVLDHEDSMAFAKTHGIRLPGYVSGTISNAADRVTRDRRKVADAKDDVARAERRRKGIAAAKKRLQAAENELKAANIALANARRSAKTSIATTIATGLAKTLSTGTSAAIGSAIKSLATKLLNAGYTKTAGSVQKKGGQLQALATKKASIAAQIATANQYATDQAGGINDFLSISGTSASSVGDLISQMGSQQKTASSFVSLSQSLKARGASKALLEELSESGPGSQLATILGGKSVTTQDIAKLNKLTASGSTLATGFGKSMADLMYDSGKDASKGFLAGLKSQEAALGKQMASIATSLVKQIKKVLKIKSPSVVFRDEVGKQLALGMVVGMDRHRPHIAAAATRMATTARKAAVLPSAPGRQAAAFDRLAAVLASGQAAGTEVHIHFDDLALKDLIRTTTKPMIKASEANTAYRAKVGRR
ncbi:phage tail tape measure protein [Streptomyces sp. NPDC101455]|uniref:phage tail tape measure protein n=1 Tax=Streptomyces sp. NPDC101455 TaxID=3366142 RepID=UPI003807CF29